MTDDSIAVNVGTDDNGDMALSDAEVREDTDSVDLSAYEFQDINLALGCSYDLNNLCAEDSLHCESENSNIAYISDNGELVAQSEGKTNIIVTNNEQSRSFQVCVTNPQISMTEINKIVGNTASLAVYGTTGDIVWQSDNDAIATVDDGGIVYAMPTGCGMSTSIHAYVDGTDLTCTINVEPVPQLDTTYKIYSEGHIRSTLGSYNCNLTAYSNANKVIRFAQTQTDGSAFYEDFAAEIEEVINLNKVDYSDGYTFPIYETYVNDSLDRSGDFAHIEIYLVGTSQDANVLTKSTQAYEMEASYKAENGYGVISVWVNELGYTNQKNAGLVYVEVDGIEYCFNIQVRGYGLTSADNLPKSDTLEEYTENDVVEISYSGDYAELLQFSYTFLPNNVANEFGEKFVDTLQDKAVSACVDLLLSAIF
ncbi:MAG: hypothetical protein J1F18_11675 [Lachnospiraceae bacterium]|nr:hypothetical protein [Lachnospiraceae bacterium]